MLMLLLIKMKEKAYPFFIISVIILTFFCGTVHYLNKPSYNWLSSSTIKFTNNWLSDGIAADKYTMSEQPLSIEAQTLQERHPYISYPNGTVLLTYGIARLSGHSQIDMRFVKTVSTVFYLLDALLIGILIYLFLIYILKLKSGYGNIVLPVFLACLWIILPNNVYYLKNVFFADQLVLFFIYLFLLLEALKNFVPQANSKNRKIINGLLFLTVFAGMMVEYYFWIQVFMVCLIHLIDSLIKKEKPIIILRKLSVYIIPALSAIGYFILQITQINNWRHVLESKFMERTGQSNVISQNYILKIGYRVYQTYQAIGLLLFLVAFIAIIYLIVRKKRFDEVLKFSSILILPVIIQILVFMNHSAIHEFSMLKLGVPFLLGIILISYSITLYIKKSKLSFTPLSIIIITGYLFYIQWNIPAFYCARLNGDKTLYMSGFEPIIENLNQYENVFFSFTDSIPVNPPLSIAQTKKMVYKIGKTDDIKAKFPNLDSAANIMLLVNKNAEKNAQILQEEQSVTENAELVKETDLFAVYKLNLSYRR